MIKGTRRIMPTTKPQLVEVIYLWIYRNPLNKQQKLNTVELPTSDHAVTIMRVAPERGALGDGRASKTQGKDSASIWDKYLTSGCQRYLRLMSWLQRALNRGIERLSFGKSNWLPCHLSIFSKNPVYI